MSIETSHLVPAERTRVWEWHTRDGALARLTPPFLPMTPRQQATNLATGTTVLAMPAGLKWEARHDLASYQPGRQFADVCVTAPFRAIAQWRHEHTFRDAPGGTLITDRVSTRAPGSVLRPMFAYRQQQLIKDMKFLNELAVFGTSSLRIALTGSRGIVGRALAAQLRTAGHTVIPLVRDKVSPGQRHWVPEQPDPTLLENIDVLVHLAGEPIFGRFNESHKTAIRNSRLIPTRRLAELVAASASVTTMVTASAIGFYGADRGDEILDPESEQGEGFLAEVVADWEAATTPAQLAGKRTVQVRTGIALSGRGGMVPVLRALFSTGLGGSFGDGASWMSWIALDDLTDIYVRAILDSQLSGPLNAVAPHPMRNKDFAAELGRQMRRPSFVPVPALGPKLLLGTEGATELALANQRVAALSAHRFRYPQLAEALAHELGNEHLADDEEIHD